MNYNALKDRRYRKLEGSVWLLHLVSKHLQRHLVVKVKQ